MREMIVSELTQAVQELARGFARFLPRLIVLVIIAFAGWVIAYLLKILARSILRLIRFDRLSDNAGASQLLAKAALPPSSELVSRFVFWVAWLGFILLGISVLGMTLVLQFVVSFGFILPVNSPQGMVGYGTGAFLARDFIRTGIALTVAAYLLTLLFGATYWHWLGYV